MQHVGSLVVVSRLWSIVSIVVAHGLTCSVECGIFPDHGLNWQADSFTTEPPGKSLSSDQFSHSVVSDSL